MQIRFGAIFVVWMLLTGGSASAQAPVANIPAVKSFTFDVVSIRQNKSGLPMQPGSTPYGPTPDGWHMTNMPLAIAIYSAYVPQTGGSAFYVPSQIKEMPAWAIAQHYDIVAKVSEGNLADWQKPTEQPAMMHAMLKAMLAERCKLTAHREMKEVPVYALVLGKGGPKFKEEPVDEQHPSGVTPSGGGTFVPEDGGRTIHFYAAPMASLAALLADRYVRRNVQDRTGLTGKYNFVLPSPTNGDNATDPGPSIFTVLEDLGLKLEPTKGLVETLVIDHAESPSEN
jgi:uncharacterized protein (TIGR03435 family)